MTLEEHCEDRWPLGWRPARYAGAALAEVGNFRLCVHRISSYYNPFQVQIYPRDSNHLLAVREADSLRDLLRWAFTYVKEHPPYIPELTP